MSTVVLYIQFRVFWQKLVWFYVNCMSSWADQMIKGPLFLLTSFLHVYGLRSAQLYNLFVNILDCLLLEPGLRSQSILVED